ncbi:MAG: Rrf2 family transcriptional regulator [Firmicutes bacterium]|nr:Rrf2 family transcriptional regulator [Bacillota bacterium]
MKPSAKTLYACQALVELAQQYPSRRPVLIEDIARRHNIPLKFLQQILLSLKAAGLVESRRGPEGGYLLARPPGQITLYEIVTPLDPPSPPKRSNPLPNSQWSALPVWREIDETVKVILESYTLEKILLLSQGPQGMYYI